MAGLKVTITGEPEHFDDILGRLPAPPQSPTALPLSPMARSRMPLTLTPYQRMGLPAAGPSPSLAPPVLGKIPPLPDTSAVTSPAALPPPPRTRLGEVKHVLGEIGEVAGSALVPNLMKWIPGTEQNKMLQEAEQERKGLARSEQGLRTAEAERDTAEARKAEQQPGETAPATVESGGQAYQFNPQSGKYDIPIGNPKLPTDKTLNPEQQAFDAYVKQGMSPEDAYRAVLRDQAANKPKTEKFDPIATELGGEPTGNAYKGVTYKTPEEAQQAYAKDYVETQSRLHPEFPRMIPVTDAQGNIRGAIGYTGTAGGITSKYIPNTSIAGFPQDLGTTPGVIPPKPTASVLTQSQRAEMIQPQVEALESQIDKVAPELGPYKGRLADVLTGKIGADNPAIARLQMQLTMFTTALMLAHGLRGEAYQEELGKYLSAAQSPDNLKERVRAANGYLMDYARSTGHGGGAITANPQGQAPAAAAPDAVSQAIQQFRAKQGKK